MNFDTFKQLLLKNPSEEITDDYIRTTYSYYQKLHAHQDCFQDIKKLDFRNFSYAVQINPLVEKLLKQTEAELNCQLSQNQREFAVWLFSEYG
jgi:hypothetical protein